MFRHDFFLDWHGPHYIKNLESIKVKLLNILKVIFHYSWKQIGKPCLGYMFHYVYRNWICGCHIYSPVIDDTLKVVDIGLNYGTRICNETFISSKVKSLYADSGELPMNWRPKELCLFTIERMEVFDQHPELSKPFNVIIRYIINENGLDVIQEGFAWFSYQKESFIKLCRDWMKMAKSYMLLW